MVPLLFVSMIRINRKYSGREQTEWSASQTSPTHDSMYAAITRLLLRLSTVPFSLATKSADQRWKRRSRRASSRSQTSQPPGTDASVQSEAIVLQRTRLHLRSNAGNRYTSHSERRVKSACRKKRRFLLICSGPYLTSCPAVTIGRM